MKKILALILALTMLASLAACGEKPAEAPEKEDAAIGEVQNTPDATDDEKAEEKKDDEKDNEKDGKKDPVETEKKEEQKEETTKQEKPEAEKEEPEKTEEKPAQSGTVGNTLLSAFKAKANSGGALGIAEALAQHESLPFMAGASAVEPGLLSGFDNAQIEGFKEGAMFAPMMSSIAFVGYVFVLEDGVNAADFIANLRKNANLRWNICVEAEEMVTGSVGNKVFFVMCPKQFEE